MRRGMSTGRVRAKPFCDKLLADEIGMQNLADEPDNVVLRLLRDMRERMATKADLAELAAKMATKADLAEMVTKTDLDSKLNSLRADVASDLVLLRKDLSEQIVGLRRAVVEYHSTTVGHGILISELEARVRRVGQHLNLPPLAAH